jgi:4-hydroxy-tetrahydrodipicolinate reductase
MTVPASDTTGTPLRPLRLLIVGYGRMGRLVDSLAPGHGMTVAGRLDEFNNVDGAGITANLCRDVDVAIDFSIAEAVPVNLPRLAALKVNLVVGTTGWQAAAEASLRRIAEDAGIGVVAAANFSLGVNLFQMMVEQAARLFGPQDGFGAWIHEAHHAAKKDAPSGTALVLERAMRDEGYARPIDMSSTRAGSIPGTHTVGFDSPFETVTLTHTARDRATFAVGALAAARWVVGRRGWYAMRDVLHPQP